MSLQVLHQNNDREEPKQICQLFKKPDLTFPDLLLHRVPAFSLPAFLLHRVPALSLPVFPQYQERLDPALLTALCLTRLDPQQRWKRLDLRLQCCPLLSLRSSATLKTVGPTSSMLPSFLSSLRSNIKSHWTYAFDLAIFPLLNPRQSKSTGPTPLTLATIFFPPSPTTTSKAIWTHALNITLLPHLDFLPPFLGNVRSDLHPRFRHYSSFPLLSARRKSNEHNNPLPNSLPPSLHDQAWRLSPRLIKSVIRDFSGPTPSNS